MSNGLHFGLQFRARIATPFMQKRLTLAPIFNRRVDQFPGYLIATRHA